MSRKMTDFTGERIGRLLVVKMSHKQNGRYQWLCQCDCGNKTTVDATNLRAGSTRSCGCLVKDRGVKATPIIKSGNKTIVSVNSYHHTKGGKGVGWRGGVSSLVSSVDL